MFVDWAHNQVYFFIPIVIHIIKLSLNEHFREGVNVSKRYLCLL